MIMVGCGIFGMMMMLNGVDGATANGIAMMLGLALFIAYIVVVVKKDNEKSQTREKLKEAYRQDKEKADRILAMAAQLKH